MILLPSLIIIGFLKSIWVGMVTTDWCIFEFLTLWFVNYTQVVIEVEKCFKLLMTSKICPLDTFCAFKIWSLLTCAMYGSISRHMQCTHVEFCWLDEWRGRNPFEWFCILLLSSRWGSIACKIPLKLSAVRNGNKMQISWFIIRHVLYNRNRIWLDWFSWNLLVSNAHTYDGNICSNWVADFHANIRPNLMRTKILVS